jgi:DNA-binding SARP family transcriptional activator/TolB-like protein/tetratricopeptide (TPR) repeat protein
VIFINVLGYPVLGRPEGPVTGRAAYKRRLALLSVLAVARGQRVSRERLVGLLWAEHSQEAARHTLSETLYVLRKELGDDAFVVLGGEVGLNPEGARTDVDEFETALGEGRLEDAVRAYGAPFLDGFYVSGAPEFERWAEGERDRLARACAGAVETLAQRAEAAGDPLGAAAWWRRLAEQDPFSSRVALRLARALRNGGEHAAALRHAVAHAGFLHEELGVGPDPELAAFVERLRTESIPLPHPSRTAPPTVDAEPEEEYAAAAPLTAPPSSGPPAPPIRPSAEAAALPASPPAVDAAQPLSPVIPLPHEGGQEAAETVARAAVTRGRRRRWPLLAGAAAALALLAAVLLEVRGREAGASPAAPRLDPRRIAVLYFDDYTQGGELGYLASGLTEMLIHELSQVEALDVISRNGVKPYRHGTVPLDSVAARLRVGSVVEGSVQRAGDSVRVTVQLIDAATQSHLESRVVVHSLGNVLALESALAGEVGGFLRRRLGREVRLLRSGAGTRSAAARALVLRAEQAMDDAETLAASSDTLDTASALRLLEGADSALARAEAADPAWTRPPTLRGRVAVAIYERTHGARQRDQLAAAERFAQRVLAREPRNADALQVRATARWWSGMELGPAGAARLDAAERDLRAAVAAEPELARAWGALARLLLARGRLAEAELAARRALAADAYLEDADALLLRLFFTALGTGDYRAATGTCAQGARLFPRDWRFVECGLTLLREDPSLPPDPRRAWQLVAELERLDAAPRAHAEGRAYAPVYRRVVAATVSARAGDAARARAELAWARNEVRGDTAAAVSLAYDEAYVRLVLGDRAGARARLDAYLAARPALRPYLARDPLFRDLYRPGVSDTPSGAGTR